MSHNRVVRHKRIGHLSGRAADLGHGYPPAKPGRVLVDLRQERVSRPVRGLTPGRRKR